MSAQTELDFARSNRDDGIARVLEHTPEYFREAVKAAVRQLALRGAEFTAEDIRALTGDPPNHPNAMGANISACIKSGLIKKAGRTNGTRPESHARSIQTYIATQEAE